VVLEGIMLNNGDNETRSRVTADNNKTHKLTHHISRGVVQYTAASTVSRHVLDVLFTSPTVNEKILLRDDVPLANKQRHLGS